ncbi:MAG: LysR family transcriptional regulator [Sandaracinaceae bacterium]
MADISWLNYHHLLYFAAVVEEEGLVPAARRLGVSHPTVSEQVRKLEDHLGLALFERRGRKLQLTENGRMVYGYAAQIFGIGNALLEAVTGARSGRSILCRVGIDSVLPKLEARRFLSPLLDTLGDALRLRCVEDGREALVGMLRARQLDVVLSDAPASGSSASDIGAHLLSAAPLVLFATPELAERLAGPPFPSNLDGAPFLLPMPATRVRRELEAWLEAHRVRPRVVAEMEDSGLIKAFGQEGRGVFVMPADVRDDVCRQYGVTALGVTEGAEARVFAMARSRENPAVAALLEAAGR